MEKKKTKKPRAKRPRTDGLTERFMVRCSLEQLKAWGAEAARRGFSRPNDSGIGRLVGLEMDQVVADQALRAAAQAFDERRKADQGDAIRTLPPGTIQETHS